MILNDLVDSFCYSQKNAGLKGLTHFYVIQVAQLLQRPRELSNFKGCVTLKKYVEACKWRSDSRNGLNGWINWTSAAVALGIFTARRSYASAVSGVVILSVYPSVCHMHALWQNQTIHCGYCDTTQTAITLVFDTNSGWWATPPFVWYLRYLLRLSFYKREAVEVGVFRRGWVTLSANIRRKEASPTSHC